MNMSDRTDAVYIISVAAEIVGMHPQTLRVYERKGLVAQWQYRGSSTSRLLIVTS